MSFLHTVSGFSNRMRSSDVEQAQSRDAALSCCKEPVEDVQDPQEVCGHIHIRRHTEEMEYYLSWNALGVPKVGERRTFGLPSVACCHWDPAMVKGRKWMFYSLEIIYVNWGTGSENRILDASQMPSVLESCWSVSPTCCGISPTQWEKTRTLWPARLSATMSWYVRMRRQVPSTVIHYMRQDVLSCPTLHTCWVR